ncbi:MAG: hypothetical protein AAGG75_24865 [Bacteroidota bacterium]
MKTVYGFLSTLVLCCIFFSFTTPTTSTADRPIPLVERVVLDGKLTIKVPEGFRLMTAEEIEARYPSGNRPALVYTDESLSVNIAINHTQNPAAADQLPEFLSAFEGQFEQSGMVEKWIRKDMVKVKGQDAVQLEMMTKAPNTEIYNMVTGTVLEERLLLVSFNCVERLKDIWRPVAVQVSESITTKK